MSDDNDISFRKIERKEFKSTIPEHLMEGSSPQTRFIMDSLSINAQQNEYIVEAVCSMSEGVNNLHVRLKPIESLKRRLTDYRVLLAAIVVAFISFVEVVPAAVWTAKWISNRTSYDGSVEVSSGLQITPKDSSGVAIHNPQLSPKKSSPLVIEQTTAN